MIPDILADAETRMEKAVDALKKDLASLRAGRANPALLDGIQVEYYGVSTPINQVANISAPEPRLLVVQPWDKSIIAEIERAILKSDLGVTPNNDGNVIRIALPQLTEERRKELVKVVKKKAEESRVAVRNIRRDANDQVKSLEKKGEISEDEARRGQEQVQKLTDKYIEMIDHILQNKEKEIMEI
ncbi:ribosome recycling factor [Calderihabitans maritimus]|uniref:Ribosome-recycling factor n=1 Tax=Calderihabitans maritimus TaxID=1246530 RepID=A0A1Z5HYF5_9FIRM|nr:ribosome recycling factor [Calderihabitans maritimus]GAW94320.1 ribosome recycling factor [Calderihabitans maritimus]